MRTLNSDKDASVEDVMSQAASATGASEIFKNIARMEEEAAAALATLGHNEAADRMLVTAAEHYQNATNATQQATEARRQQMRLMEGPESTTF